VSRLAALFEILGGARPLPARPERSSVAALAQGVYWVLLLLLTLSFMGRSAKFIYIDF